MQAARPALQDSPLLFSTHSARPRRLLPSQLVGYGGCQLPIRCLGSDASQSFNLTIDEPPVIITPNSTPITMANHVALSVPLPTFMSSGNPGATLSVIGALPTGIVQHHAAGSLTLSGTPSVTGVLPRTFTFVIVASVGGMPKSYQKFSIVVN